MKDLDNLPELFTQREIEKARSRHRWLGRVEGAGAVIAVGALVSLINWIPSLLVVAVVGYVLWKLLSGPKEKAPEE